MDLSSYEEFERLSNAGLRRQAVPYLKAFLASFKDESEREQWTVSFLATHTYGSKMRHEVFEDVVFPVLLAGWQRKDVWSMYWLAGTSQNLYSAKQLWKKYDYPSEFGFLMEAIAIDPDHVDVRAALLNVLLDQMNYAEHEWPAAILSGNEGASLDDCANFAERISLARELDEGISNAGFIDEFERKLRIYQERLFERGASSS